jgi:hypothetical protein
VGSTSKRFWNCCSLEFSWIRCRERGLEDDCEEDEYECDVVDGGKFVNKVDVVAIPNVVTVVVVVVVVAIVVVVFVGKRSGDDCG